MSLLWRFLRRGLTVQSRQAVRSPCSSLGLPSAGMTSMCHHTQLSIFFECKKTDKNFKYEMSRYFLLFCLTTLFANQNLTEAVKPPILNFFTLTEFGIFGRSVLLD